MTNVANRFALVSLFVFTLAPIGCSSAGEESDGSKDRIVGGTAAAATDYPWMVATFFGSDASGWGQGCGGALIDATHVITAAHCSIDRKTLPDLHQTEVAPMAATSLRVAIRPSTIKGVTPADLIPVTKVLVNPRYDASKSDGDLAILELARPVSLPSYPKIAGSVRVDALVAAQSSVRVIGYGTIAEGGPTSDVLNQVDVKLIPTAVCGASYGEGAISTNMVCAGIAEGGKDSCQGDSGGPLFSPGPYPELVGVVSWGRGCARPGIPGVYTRIANYTDWIRTCQNGTCEGFAPKRSCDSLYADCDGNVVNGCEKDLLAKTSCGDTCAAPACGEGESCVYDINKATEGPACKPAKAIKPTLACVWDRPNGIRIASFGYKNENEGVVRIESGAMNKVEGVRFVYPENLRFFFPGGFGNSLLAVLDRDASGAWLGKWTITDPTNTANSASIAADTPQCASDPTQAPMDVPTRSFAPMFAH